MLKIIFLALLSTLAAASNPPSPGGGNGDGEHQTNSADKHADTQTDKRGTPEAPFIIQIQQPPSQDAITPEPKHQGEWYTRSDGLIAAFTGGLFIATTGLWIFTALLWCSTRATAKAIVSNERPWVGLKTNFPPENGIAVGANEIRMVIINIGRTPALKMRVKFIAHVLPKDADWPLPNNRGESPKPLFPDVLDYHPTIAQASETDIKGISDGSLILWVVGRIDYGQNGEYTTTICLRWDISRAPPELVPNKDGNDAI